ncbi:HD domain-containing protein, partial [Clostridium estertheticum]
MYLVICVLKCKVNNFYIERKIKMFLENILDNPTCQPVAERYKKWYEFMEKNVEFSFIDSEMHTKHHCARVLLLALIIAHQIGLSDEEMNSLSMAAVFHDSRRLDDWLDTGHGKRAAEYYKESYSKYDISFDERTYYVMAYHDRDDVLGLSEIKKSPALSQNCILLYKIFKDSDGLDRFRLGPDGLDVNMLRTKEAS